MLFPGNEKFDFSVNNRLVKQCYRLAVGDLDIRQEPDEYHFSHWLRFLPRSIECFVEHFRYNFP